MTKRNNPKTSRDAHNSIKPAKSYYHKKIIEALQRIKVGATFEEAAKVAGIKPDQAWRRMSELVQAGVCYNVGITRATSSGRKAMVRQLTGLKAVEITSNPKTDKEQKAANTIRQLSLL